MLRAPVYCLVILLAAGSAPAHDEEAPIRPEDLGKAAKDAPAIVAKLFQELSRPADEVVLADGTAVTVKPIPRFLGRKPSFAGKLEVVVVNGKEEQRRDLGSGDLIGFTPYEERALAALQSWQAAAKDLHPDVTFRALELSLRAVLRFHLEIRLRPAVGEDPWQALRSRLERELRDSRRRHLLHAIDKAGDEAGWKAAELVANRLLAIYPEDNTIAEQARRLWARAGEWSLKAGRFADARNYLTRLENAFLFAPEGDGLRQGLRARAQTLFKEAEGLPDDTAVPKLKEALTLWPRLPGLRDALLARQKAYRIVYVGVRELPEYLSPATAVTDSEKQAVELLFESLVQPIEDGTRGEHFVPRLALRLPAPSAATRGDEGWQRQFSLRRDAAWSDGERVTSADVRQTILLMDLATLAGRQPAWSSLVEVPRVEQAGFDVTLRLRQSVLEPLSLLSFKVLPQRYRGKPLERADDPDFAKNPVGSGPYVFRGRRSDGGREYAVFTANPQFERGSPPAIREIRLFAWQRPADLRALPHPVHLLLGIRTEELAALRALGFRDIRSRPAPRTAFLAVNHRVPGLANQSLRRFLARAIDRETLLNDHFRGGPAVVNRLGPIGSAIGVAIGKSVSPQPEFHVPLNGPYPTKSWAECPPTRVPAALYDVDLAKSEARQVHKQLGAVQLVLKVPADDPRVVRACMRMAEEIGRLAADAGAVVELKIEPLPPRQLKEAVDRRDYQLAYWTWDYADQTCWLWPLFDQSADAIAAGGSNILCYDNDANLESLFRGMLGQRHFPTLQQRAHDIHAHLVDRMPLIPLWQLHHHVAVHPHLHPMHLDPLLVFTDVARWTVDAE